MFYRLARYGPVHQSNGVLQSQLAHAESINKQWRDLLSDTLGLQLQEDVNAVVTHVKALQEESAQQNSARARLETQLKLLQVQLKDEFARSQLLAQQHQDRLSQLTTASSALQAAQRQLANATKQRDAYKTALDSYNEFEAAPARDEARQTQLKEQSDQLQSAQAELAALKLEREVLQSEVKHLSQHLTRVEAENTVLYSKVSSGEFDPTNTKVWHFKANPAAQVDVKFMCLCLHSCMYGFYAGRVRAARRARTPDQATDCGGLPPHRAAVSNNTLLFPLQ